MQPDRTLLRRFLAVAKTGSVSAAARSLGQSQPRLGRHVHDREAQLGTPLFTRALRGITRRRGDFAVRCDDQVVH